MEIILFIAALAILVLSHELGHFLFARIFGAKVEEFGFGFPPRLFGFKKGETVYSVNAVPLGGFVKILGEDSSAKEPGSFGARPVYAKAAILAAGVFFNLLLAWMLFSAVNAAGAPTIVEDGTPGSSITVLEVQKGTPAEKAGIAPGDSLLNFYYEGRLFKPQRISEVQNFIADHKGEEIGVEYARGNEIYKVFAVPDQNPEGGRGALGIAMGNIAIVPMPFYKAMSEGFKETVFIISATAKALGSMVLQLVKGEGAEVQVMGPVGIAGLVGAASQTGFAYLLQLLGLLSINLAIINFVPFPALDGGRLLFLVIETIKRSPIPQKVVSVSNGLGFAILIGLMVLVTYRDIAQLF
ncbi:MAG: site-2 protease family protein [Candidatus Pacebacteria bacterium]|nr:site-2 protease family protein [Candidatus Paceibacterota bacterium]